MKSENRFTLIGLDNETIKDDATKECYFVIEYVQRKKLVSLLNEQQATITKLQELNDDKGKRIISLIRANKTLKGENEKLKEINKDKEQDVLHLYKKNEKLRKQNNKYVVMMNANANLNQMLQGENERLRNAIQSFLKEADIFSEEAIEHDIIAYREMGKFDNKDAYYLACAIAELKKVIGDE